MHSAGAQTFLFNKYNIAVEPNLLDSEYENRYVKAAFGNVWSWHAAVLIHQCGRSQDDIRIMDKTKVYNIPSCPTQHHMHRMPSQSSTHCFLVCRPRMQCIASSGCTLAS